MKKKTPLHSSSAEVRVVSVLAASDRTYILAAPKPPAPRQPIKEHERGVRPPTKPTRPLLKQSDVIEYLVVYYNLTAGWDCQMFFSDPRGRAFGAGDRVFRTVPVTC